MLDIHNLAAIRGDQLIFADLSFSLRAGEALAITGRNGAGKTTLLRLVAGLAQPAAGEIHWCGEDVRASPAEYQLRLAYLGHQDAVKPGLTAAENLSIWAPGRGDARAAAVRGALAATGLGELAHVPGRMLSAGQRRRLATQPPLPAPRRSLAHG